MNRLMMNRLMMSGMMVLAVAACSPKPVETPDAASASAAAPAVIGNVLSCVGPVGKKDTAASLKVRYKDQAAVETVPGPEGTELKAVVLFGKEPAKRLEVLFWDEAMTKISDVRLADDASSWTVEGLRTGSTLSDVETRNGKAFKLSGFGWDYGGYVTDFMGGRLSSLEGGCVISVRLDATGNTDPTVSGDTQLMSSDKAVVAAQPKVTQLSIGWPA